MRAVEESEGFLSKWECARSQKQVRFIMGGIGRCSVVTPKKKWGRQKSFYETCVGTSVQKESELEMGKLCVAVVAPRIGNIQMHL